MTDQEKQVIAKLQIIKELATENSVKQLADVQIEYIRAVSKGKIGFQQEEKNND